MHTRMFRLALLGAFLAAAGALLITFGPPSHAALLALLGSGILFGTTVTYAYPGTPGGTTPPTFPVRQSMVNVQVSFGTTDTVAVITHNFNLTAAQLAAQQPLIMLYQATGGSGTVDAQLTFAATDGNTVTITKNATGAGTERIINVTVLRPNSLIG
jgi:hypothetical protein